MTASQGVIGLCTQFRTHYENFTRKGLTPDWFHGRERTIFTEVMKKRAEQPSKDDLYIPGLSLATHDISDLLDWSVAKYVHADEIFTGLETQYIKERVKEISNGVTSRGGAAEAAVKFSNLAEGGGAAEDDLLSMLDNAAAIVEARSESTYKNRFATRLQIEELGHYEPGSLVTLGGGSGHGKSTLALNLASNWMEGGLSVIYFTNEMRHEYILIKMACIITGIPWKKVMHIHNSYLSLDEKDNFISEMCDIGVYEFGIYEKPYSMSEMRMIVKARQPDIFILDTINALIPDGERTDIALGNMARDMKFLAEETDSLAVIVAQLKDIYGRPTDKNLVKESRQIRDASDYMDFIYRDSEHVNGDPELSDVFEIYRVKGRLTGIGRCFLKIDLDNGQINNFDKPRLAQLEDYFRKNKKTLFRGER